MFHAEHIPDVPRHRNRDNEMSQFRKKPVVIEAVQWTGANRSEVLSFVGKDAEWRSNFGMVIHTLEGDHFANEGDWIIRGIKGEFYPCKPDIFAATYEPADSAPSADLPLIAEAQAL